MLEHYDFKLDYARKCLDSNKHNHVTTTYYLLLKRYQRLGKIKEEDQHSAKAHSFSATQAFKSARESLTSAPIGGGSGAGGTSGPQRANPLNNTMPNPKGGAAVGSANSESTVATVSGNVSKPQNQQQINSARVKMAESFDVSSTGGSLEKKSVPTAQSSIPVPGRRNEIQNLNNTKHIYMDTSRAEQ